MSDYSEIVIIGSGFGGAVMAARLGAHVKARFGDSVRVEVVEKGGDARKPVGLLFAGGGGTTIANPINNVLSAFGVSIVGN